MRHDAVRQRARSREMARAPPRSLTSSPQDLIDRMTELVFTAVGGLAKSLNRLQLPAPQTINVFVECQMESFTLNADGIQNYTWLIHSVSKATAETTRASRRVSRNPTD